MNGLDCQSWIYDFTKFYDPMVMLEGLKSRLNDFNFVRKVDQSVTLLE